MTSARLKIQGKTYKVPALEDLTLDDIITLDAELQERYGSSWVKVQRFSQEMQALAESGRTEAEVEAASEEHPMATLMGGVTVWMVLRVAGKREITMKEALAIPSTSVEEVVLEGPKDHMPAKKKASKKSSTRKGSAPATVEPSSDDSDKPSLSSLPTSSTSRSASA
jgi:hypothetical protein